MKRKVNRRSQQRIYKIEGAEAEMAEHLRLLHKELLWAAGHVKAIYETVKPPEAPEIEDPNQLKMFEQ